MTEPVQYGIRADGVTFDPERFERELQQRVGRAELRIMQLELVLDHAREQIRNLSLALAEARQELVMAGGAQDASTDVQAASDGEPVEGARTAP